MSVKKVKKKKKLLEKYIKKNISTNKKPLKFA